MELKKGAREKNILRIYTQKRETIRRTKNKRKALDKRDETSTKKAVKNATKRRNFIIFLK